VTAAAAVGEEGDKPKSNTILFVDEATEVVTQCAEDMKSLWQDSVVRLMLAKRGVSMETSAGLCVPNSFFSYSWFNLLFFWISFLNDIERIATRSYVPSDDDVIHARLKTVGIQEHELIVGNGASYCSNSSLSFFLSDTYAFSRCRRRR
jgi:guanine nucleotide-binding protein alpha-1 subunit